MKTYAFLYFLLLPLYAFCQQPVYQPFEVDSTAIPQGGLAYLNTFILANLRKPVLAEAAGVGGRVIVRGIVEPDGHVTNTKIMQSLRPDCDREALRVFGLFNAWKPAQKEGEVVRQLVTIPILFIASTPFIYADGARVNYFDKDVHLITTKIEGAH